MVVFFAQSSSTKLALFVTKIVQKWYESSNLQINTDNTQELTDIKHELAEKELKLQEIYAVLQGSGKTGTNLVFDSKEKKVNLKRLEIENMVFKYSEFRKISMVNLWQELYSNFYFLTNIDLRDKFYTAGRNLTELDYIESNPNLLEQFYNFVNETCAAKDLSSFEIIKPYQEKNNHSIF